MVVVDAAGATWYGFAVDAKLNVLRAGELFIEIGPYRRNQSEEGVPSSGRASGLTDRRIGDG